MLNSQHPRCLKISLYWKQNWTPQALIFVCKTSHITKVGHLYEFLTFMITSTVIGTYKLYIHSTNTAEKRVS